jgi:hypothetical protein
MSIKNLLDKFLNMEIPGTKGIATAKNTELAGRAAPKPVPTADFPLWDRIPEDVKELLFVTNDPPQASNHSGFNTIELSFNKVGDNWTGLKYIDHVRNDPSTIYSKLPITVPKDITLVSKPGYYPSYIGLSPEQRYVYLNWLQDITQEIDVGYMFLFYYGLERRLLIGPFEKAFDMIVRLRKLTKNDSFLNYSGNALFYSTVGTGVEEHLYKLDFFYAALIWHDKQIMLKLFENASITPEELTKILKGMDVNKRYLDEKIYIEEMGKILSEKYRHSFLLPQDVIDEDKHKVEDTPVFANISFPDKIRIQKVDSPDLNGFILIITELHTKCHEITKKRLAELRKR